MRDEDKTKEQLTLEVRELRSRLGSSEQYLDTVLTNLPGVGVAILEGPEFRYFRINKKLAELNGLPVEAHLGRPLVEVLPHAEASLMAALRDVRRTGTPILHREFSIKLPKDPERSVHLIDWMVSVNATDRSSAVVAVILDVTELKETQKQLRQSQKMEALGTMAKGIAHDFNNILAGVQGNVELVMRSLPEDSDESEHLEVVVESTERGARLVKQILAFGRMETPPLNPLELGDVVREALRMMEGTIPKNIEVHQVIQADCAHVMADATQMYEVVVNLCTNACHAMATIGGVLEVELQESDQHPSLPGGPGGKCLRLRVKDTGRGIAPKDQERIFDPFFSTMELGHGSGLGLSVVHGIVESHQGVITVESKVGEGSTFSVFLPITGEATVDEV